MNITESLLLEIDNRIINQIITVANKYNKIYATARIKKLIKEYNKI